MALSTGERIAQNILIVDRFVSRARLRPVYRTEDGIYFYLSNKIIYV